MILLTDGRASDDRLSLMMAGWKMQAAAWCNSFAIGLDPDADEEELFLIGGDLQHYALIDEVRLYIFLFIETKEEYQMGFYIMFHFDTMN